MALTPLQKLSVTGAAALVVLGLFGATSFYYASRLVEADRAVERANATMSAALHIAAGTKDGERATKAYVVRGDSTASAALRDAQSRVEDAVDAIGRASEDNPHQRSLLSALANQVSASFDEYRMTVSLRDRFGADSARRFLMHGMPPAEVDSLMRIVTHMREEELRVLAEQARQQSAQGMHAQRIILVGMALTFLLAGVALQPMRAGVARRLTSHLTKVDASSPELAGEPGNPASAAAQLRAVHGLVAALEMPHDPATGARVFVEHGTGPLGAVLSAVIVPSGAGGFTVLASSDASFDSVSPELAPPVAEVLRTSAVSSAESLHARTRRYGTLAGLDARGATGAVLFVPMRRDNTVTGVWLVALADDHLFTEDELAFAATLGRLGGPAVASRAHSI